MNNNKPILDLRKISKNFMAVQALREVDFSVSKGEVRALVGENGAGKSTLVKIIAGALKPCKGQIFINGNQVNFDSPKAAIKNGISCIYQELDLVPTLNGILNIFLGFELRNPITKTLNKKKMKIIATGLLKKMGADIDLDKPVGKLPICEQQIITICKAQVLESKIIMMDEPSSSLSSKELENLFSLIRNLKKYNITIIYISHRLEEIFEIADSVTVLRDGKHISTNKIYEVNKEEIIERMIGRKLKEVRINPDTFNPKSKNILEVRNLSYKNILKRINFKVKKGEILGILGLVGSGRLELARILSGVYKQTSGEIFLNDKSLNIESPSDAIDNSISYVPDERRSQGLFLNLNVLLNSTMMTIPKLSNRIGIINKKKIKGTFNKYQKILNIKCSSQGQLVSKLSGGNQQKVVFAKCLARNTEIVILNEPTKGIDVGSKFEIYRVLIEIARKNKTIIVFSSEIPELCNVSDRIIVLKKGEISKIFEVTEINQQDVFKELLS